MKRNMDEQVSLYRMAITGNMNKGISEIEDKIRILEKEVKEASEETKKAKQEELDKKKAELKDTKNKNNEKYGSVLEEMNQKWASAQNMLAQNIRDIASDKDYAGTEISGLLGLSGLSEDGASVTAYIKADNAGKYDAILSSQTNAVKKQQEINNLEEEYLKKEEEYNAAFNE